MYDAINSIIDHMWSSGTSGSGEQQYIYYISGAVIVLFTVYLLDLIKSLIFTCAGKR